MKLSTKMRYGTRALLELALHYEQGTISLTQVAAAQEMPDKYLESLFALLRSAGLVLGQRGPQGGYRLARRPAQITLRDVYAVLEGPEPFVPCTRDRSDCPRSANCVTQEIWARMYEAGMAVLKETTLADLAARARENRPGGYMYYI